jgi:hypothetical protein
MTAGNPPVAAADLGSGAGEKVRPLGVVALSFVDALGGALSIVLGLSFLLSSKDLVAIVQQDPSFANLGTDVLMSGIELLAGFFVVVGALAILNAYGLWKGKNWAWWMALMLALIGAFSSAFAFPLGIVSLAVELLIAYYLTRRTVRDYFRPVAETLPKSMA